MGISCCVYRGKEISITISDSKQFQIVDGATLKHHGMQSLGDRIGQ
jgi:hypothetical protein